MHLLTITRNTIKIEIPIPIENNVKDGCGAFSITFL